MLDADRWAEASRLLDRLLDLPAEDRQPFLVRACHGDPVLRTEVEHLWKEMEAAAEDSFLSRGALGGVLGEQFLDATEAEDLAPGDVVGRYRIVREIGHGGMGTVYLAERADGAYEQRVALKRVRRGLDTKAVLRRFVRERQVLARLEHPNVARLLDAGVTDDGLPYFVMEYVEGEPITDYSDRRRLGIDDRLKLFEQVCGAVRYAHQNLVVHRDLKPSNILVAEAADGAPTVKLLDFGIAKVLRGDGEAVATLTEEAGRVMTPAYAAPEQVRGAAMTTATDVYALGVVLYELLTGHRPYVLAERSQQAVAEAVLGQEPLRPSAVVGRAHDRWNPQGETRTVRPEEASAARGMKTGRLQRRLRGDLDRICLKALRKEPERRYGSAEELGEDVRRYLGGLPVEARPDGVGYRVGKFVRRHRAGVAAAVLVVLALAGGLGAALWQARVAAMERDTARREAATAEQVKAYLTEVFGASDPLGISDQEGGPDLTARTLLERGVERSETLRQEPDVQAEISDALGDVYQGLGLYEEARTLKEKALTIRRAYWGAEHVDVASSLHSLSVLLSDAGGYDEAESLARDAYSMRRRLLGEEHPDVARSLGQWAKTLAWNGKYDEAEVLFREALAMQRRLLGDEHYDVATTMINLGSLLEAKGEYDEAETFYRDALATYRGLLGDEHPVVAMAMNNVAVVLRKKGYYDDAELLYRESLRVRRQQLGEEHPRVAQSLNNIGSLLIDKGDLVGAERVFREALAMQRRLLGDRHDAVAVTLSNLALSLVRRDAYRDAEPIIREALATQRHLYGDEHPRVAHTMTALGVVLYKLGSYDEAEALFREALAVQRRMLGDAHPATASTNYWLGVLLAHTNRVNEAESVLRIAHEATSGTLGGQHQETARASVALGRVLTTLGRHDEAALLLQQADAFYEGGGGTRKDSADAREALVELYTAWGRPHEAARYQRSE